jgi:transcriptional regulator with XRE-family HTH domain
MNFARIFRMLRAELRMTQFDFAVVLKVSQSGASKLERGKIKPTAENFVRAYWLAHARDCPQSKLALAEILHPRK